MTIFDLICMAAFFATAILLVATVVAALRGRRRLALGLLRGLAIFITVYLVVIVVVSLASPQRVLQLNDPQCFDDWCIAVASVEQAPVADDVSYTVALRVFSRARGRPQRENGVSVYMLDGYGRQYQPQDDPDAVPLDVLLDPGESVIATRRFVLPADARNPGLVVAHGRFPGMLIIGDDRSLLHKPSVVRFP